MINPLKKFHPRFSWIEFIIAFVIVIVVADIVIAIDRTNKANIRDKQREAMVQKIDKSLEQYYNTKGRGFYPTLADLSDPAWVNKNLHSLSAYTPKSQDAQNGASSLNTYQYSSSDTSTTCTNADSVMSPNSGCSDFTILVKLENGSTYKQSSLNGQ